MFEVAALDNGSSYTSFTALACESTGVS